MGQTQNPTQLKLFIAFTYTIELKQNLTVTFLGHQNLSRILQVYQRIMGGSQQKEQIQTIQQMKVNRLQLQSKPTQPLLSQTNKNTQQSLSNPNNQIQQQQHQPVQQQQFHQPLVQKQPQQIVQKQRPFQEELRQPNQMQFLQQEQYSDDAQENAVVDEKPNFQELNINVKTMIFFKVGFNPQYTDDILVYDETINEVQHFNPIGSKEVVKRILKPPSDVEVLMRGSLYENYVRALGRFIIWKHKWGFVMNLLSYSIVREGKISPFWTVILQQPYFIEIFRRYAFYVLDIDESAREYAIPNSFDEPVQVNIDAAIPLFEHQKQEVSWMLKCEQQPLITYLTDLKYVPFLDTGLYFDPQNLSRFFQKRELKHGQSECRAGVLASQIGSGKTASMITLIQQSCQGQTLVVVPDSILYQWKSEFEKFSQLKVLMVDKAQDKGPFEQYQVILTTRSILSTQKSPIKDYILQMSFERVILDEIHEITQSKQSSASNLLISFFVGIKRMFTWGMTGTPQNLNYRNQNTTFIKLMKLPNEFSQINTQNKLLELFVKNFMRMNPCPKVLPKLSKEVKSVYFQQIQKLVYNAHMHGDQHEAAQELCSHLKGQFTLGIRDDERIEKAIALIQEKMQLEIQRVQERLMDPRTLHKEPLQIRLKNLLSQDNFYQEVIKQLSVEQFECPLCIEEIDTHLIVIPQCFHQVCEACYGMMQKQMAMFLCPICKQVVEDKHLIIHPKMRVDQPSKMDVLIQYLNQLPPSDKVIIFTQFDDLVNHMYLLFTIQRCVLFEQLRIPYIRLRGEPSDINICLHQFKTVESIRIIIMSVEQAASGINVTEANHVIFVHPLFGFNNDKAKLTYAQCIGRAHRLGQKRNVQAMLFFTHHSIEEQQMYRFLE